MLELGCVITVVITHGMSNGMSFMLDVDLARPLSMSYTSPPAINPFLSSAFATGEDHRKGGNVMLLGIFPSVFREEAFAPTSDLEFLVSYVAPLHVRSHSGS